MKLNKIILTTLLTSSLFAGYTQNISSTIEGGNNYGVASILKINSSISGSDYTISVSKADGGTFRTSGDIYIKTGSYETFGNNRHSDRILAGATSKSFTHNMNDYDTYPKEIYARYESDEADGWAWVGAITISQYFPSKPTISINSTATINQPIVATLTRGTISDTNRVKVQCTVTNSNYSGDNPYKSSFTNGGDNTSMSLVFSSLGSQTIWCTSFDEVGLASEVVETTINIIDAPTTDIPPIVVDTPLVVTPPIVEDNIPVAEVEGEIAIGGLSYWFTPYRCFDSIAPTLELKIQKNTVDSANNRILDLEYDTSGGSQSCVDTFGETYQLRFGTRWRAEGLEFGDLTADEDKRIYKYKKVRVTVPSGQSTEIRLAVITTLGNLMVKTLFVDSDGNVAMSQTTTYGLNGIEITDPNILSKIKLLIADLQSIKLEFEALLSSPRSEKKVKDDDKNDLKHKYDAIKKRLDKAKKLVRDMKKDLKHHDNKKALEKELKKIEKAINDIKKKIDRYKKSKDNSVTAIDALKSAIDDIIAMLMSGDSKVEESNNGIFVEYAKGRGHYILYAEELSVISEQLSDGIRLLLEELMEIVLYHDMRVRIKVKHNEIKIDLKRSKSHVDKNGRLSVDMDVDDNQSIHIDMDKYGSIETKVKRGKRHISIKTKLDNSEVFVDKDGVFVFSCKKKHKKGHKKLKVTIDIELGVLFSFITIDSNGNEVETKKRHHRVKESDDDNSFEIVELFGELNFKLVTTLNNTYIVE
ncbi:MAG: hypothetical protein QM493_10485 [Sulfurovum sp.]